MTRKRWLIAAAALVLVLAAPLAWWLISPLFITVRVDEDFPAAQAAPAMEEDHDQAMMEDEEEGKDADMAATATSEATAEPMDETPMASPEAMKEDDGMSSETDTAMKEDAEEMMAEQDDMATEAPTAMPSEPVVLKRGQFHAVEHEGSGTATIYQLADGTRILRFEDFEVLNGPDLYVWLSSAPDANDAPTILNSNYVSLGRLKGNVGNQNYELPPDLDVNAYNSVTIWCQAFSVNFATAPLQ